jgi:hypothetical protein
MFIIGMTSVTGPSAGKSIKITPRIRNYKPAVCNRPGVTQHLPGLNVAPGAYWLFKQANLADNEWASL